MIRFFDFIFSLIGLIFLSPLLIFCLVVGYLDNGDPIFKQFRVGYNQKTFLLFKLRTMDVGTPSVATHLLDNSSITFFGKFLRQTKIDEILQLWNVLIGDMSIVGPRPCLISQKKLVFERKKRGVFKVKPGITGLAQLSGVTMKRPTLLAITDARMIKQSSLYYYFYYIIRTVIYIIFRKI